MPGAPALVPLDGADALDARLAGGKAANLARARRAGLPALPGIVLTTAAEPAAEGLRAAWEELSRGGRDALVVRSSSVAEDLEHTAMAGQFRSVLGVRTVDDLRAAVADVRASAHGPGRSGQPMAVLVQPMLEVAKGGVLFGVDPVTGAAERVVEVVAGGPESLVGGTVAATRYQLGRRGRVHRVDRAGSAPTLSAHERRRLCRLATRTERAFGAPQDVEWAIDGLGRLWLLQTRPVTATGHAASGPLLGPGPVAETFPVPLTPLEHDLWVTPMAAGITRALRTVHVASAGRLAASPVVTTVGGWVAADLELLGYATGVRRWTAALSPRHLVVRLRSAWSLGRARASIDAAAAAVVADVDARLEAVPGLSDLDDAELVGVVVAGRRWLERVHAHEVLASTLAARDLGPTGPGLASSHLAMARAQGLADDVAAARHPVVLALTAPHIGPPRPLPPAAVASPGLPGAVTDLGAREALRLRVRWVQELTARAVTELARRLAAHGRLSTPEAATWLRLDELVDVVGGRPAPPDLAGRPSSPGPPLPAVFRLADDGSPVAVDRPGTGGGVGAGGGRGAGPVVHASPHPGDVLVVATLDPALAVSLPGLAGLVAETGAVLSHLAICAREAGVPTVVAVPDACRRFPDGARVVVDGGTGEVRLLEEATP